jgi:hypothetical protein
MTQQKIHIVWPDQRTIDIALLDNPVSEYLISCVKHLQHIDLQFDARKNPLQAEKTNLDTVIDELLNCSNKVNLEVDSDMLTDQNYLNQLHAIYFKNAEHGDFDSNWLRIHDCIHLIENFIGNGLTRSSIWFDYENKAGPLIKPFDRAWLKFATTDIVPGMCYIREHELGKNPALYYQHQEPLDLKTVCAQSKPWVWMKPVLSIAIRACGNYSCFNESEFTQWFAPVQDAWCQHWQVLDWTPKEIFSVIPVGHVNNLSMLIDCFENLDYPKKLTL